jgi:hypothetical protein
MKPFNERHLKAGDEVPVFKQKGLVFCETSGTNKEKEPTTKVVFAFDDLCPACRKTIEPLVERIRGSEGGKKKRKPRKPRAAKAEKSNGKGTTPEYSEPKEDQAAVAKAAVAAEESSDKRPSTDTDTTVKVHHDPEGDRELIEDPETGDTYDAKTGEVVATRVRDDEKTTEQPTEKNSKGKGKGKDKASGGEAPHPF